MYLKKPHESAGRYTRYVCSQQLFYILQDSTILGADRSALQWRRFTAFIPVPIRFSAFPDE
jgi:hypothetical protein